MEDVSLLEGKAKPMAVHLVDVAKPRLYFVTFDRLERFLHDDAGVLCFLLGVQPVRNS